MSKTVIKDGEIVLDAMSPDANRASAQAKKVLKSIKMAEIGMDILNTTPGLNADQKSIGKKMGQELNQMIQKLNRMEVSLKKN